MAMRSTPSPFPHGTRSPRSRLAELLDELATKEGTHATAVPGVQLTRQSYATKRRPIVCAPNIVVIGQGRKRCYLDSEILHYNAENLLVLSVPITFESEVEASPEEPLLGVTIAVEPTMLLEMLVDLDEEADPGGPVPRGIYATPLTAELRDAVIRMLECLRSPTDSRILGRQMVREIVYRVLRGEQGGALRAMACRNDQFLRIARVLQRIQADYAQPWSTAKLAKHAGMSASTFYHNFKVVTTTSPLQYLKKIRLHRARLLMVHAGHNASTAAAAVGYESASQFGREFKRLFGASPTEETAKIRARLAAGRAEPGDRWTPESRGELGAD